MGGSIFVLPEHTFLIEFEFWSIFFKNLPFLTGILGTSVALILNIVFREYIFLLKINGLGRFIYIFFNRKWFFDLIYNHYILNKFLDFGYSVSFKLIDKGVLEWLGPLGVSKLVYRFSISITSLQTGIIYNYALFMFVGFLVFLGVALFSYLLPVSSLSFVKVTLFFSLIFVVSHCNK